MVNSQLSCNTNVRADEQAPYRLIDLHIELDIADCCGVLLCCRYPTGTHPDTLYLIVTGPPGFPRGFGLGFGLGLGLGFALGLGLGLGRWRIRRLWWWRQRRCRRAILMGAVITNSVNTGRGSG